MKTLSQFLAEANYDPEIMGRSQIKQTGEGGRKEPKRPAEQRRRPGVKPRVKAVGGGKQEPVGPYKDRKDIGSTKARSEREQQPEQERGSARERQLAAAKEERRKAAQARIAARKAGGQTSTEKPKAKDAEKKASELLKKKTKKTVSPDYKPPQASGYTRKERMAVTRAGERELSKEFKKQEMDKVEKETGKKATGKLKTIALARAHQRMNS